MSQILERVLKRTWAQVSLDAITNNYNQVRGLLAPKCRLMAMVKADAYGHGAVHVAQHLSALGADYFGVSSIDEAMQLREGGLDAPVLVLGYTPAEFLQTLAENNITQTIYDVEQAGQFSRQAKQLGVTLKVHLKVDTGMARLGLVAGQGNIEQTARQLWQIYRLPGLEVEGIFTHFACADDMESDYTQQQFEIFNKVISALEQMGARLPIKHCANSAATISNPETHLDMVRVGLCLYGLYPNGQPVGSVALQPAMQVKCIISQIKWLEADNSVSYGRTYKTDKSTKLAVIPIGYADGYSRALSNRARVLVDGEYANVVGRVCMDMCCVDVSQIENIKTGDQVTIFGTSGDKFIPVDEIANILGTISYEICCIIAKRVPRLYIKEGKPIGWLTHFNTRGI